MTEDNLHTKVDLENGSPAFAKPLLAEVFELKGGFGFRIPKRKGFGYVKSCTGWHSLNKQGKQLQDLLDSRKYIDIRLGDFCDIDGYLFINVKSEFMVHIDKAKEIEEDLKDIIVKVFPFVRGFIEGCP